MASNRDNIIFEKTSFLQGSNSPFIKELYLQYLENPTAIPQSWREFFDGLNDDKEAIQKEILGPSWAPRKNNNLKINTLERDLIKDENKEAPINGKIILQENYEKEKEESVKAIALIRAYRIRGHLIADLDPLGMMERKYLNELHLSLIHI